MKTTEIRNRWLLAIAYVLFIYATLEWAQIPMRFLREAGILTISVGLIYVLFFLGLSFKLFKDFQKPLVRFLFLTIIFLVYYLLASKIRYPEEQIHFLEYGLVGILFFRALEPHFEFSWKTFLIAFLLASAAGFLDEGIQKILPSRHFDWHDIWLNCISAALGLMIFSLFHTRKISLSSCGSG